MNVLREWQQLNLPALRQIKFEDSPYKEVTTIVYSFPEIESEEEAFSGIEHAILQTWKCIGKLKTIIVISRRFPAVVSFASKWNCVEIQEEPSLKPGSLSSMSLDCIQNLHKRFSSKWCLIIQDDGFPIKSNFDKFLGKWDFIGAPAVSDSMRNITDFLGLTTLNGGFSLRSHKICKNAAHSWRFFWRYFLPMGNRLMAEDVFYTFIARLSPLYRLRHRFPNSKEAFAFSCDTLDGYIAIPPKSDPFGFHGKATAPLFLK